VSDLSDDLEARVTAAVAGDQAAFAFLLQQEAGVGYRLAYMVLHDRSAAEDAFQDASFRAWRDLRQMRDRTRWRPWFRQIVVNAARDRARKAQRRPETALDERIATANGTAAVPGRLDLRAAFLDLDPTDRAILALRYGTGLEIAEIAAVVGMPVGTVKSRVHRALARLRGVLAR
jgi:RNA polymerase sigma-70 factor (ECF subfamily)